MNRLSKMALVAVAALALTAMVGIASASAAQFHSDASEAALKGTQMGTHKFTSGGSSVTCTGAEFTGKGSASKTSETQQMHPNYTGCTAFGFASATVNTNGCQYLFDANSENVNLEGCTNGGVTIHVSAFFGTTTCHVFIKNQNGINNNSIATGSSTDKVMTVNTTSNNIHYEVLESKGLCPLTKGETNTNAKYEGETTVEANSGANTIWKQ